MPDLLDLPEWMPLALVEPSRLSDLRDPLQQALKRGHQLKVRGIALGNFWD